MSSRAVWKGSMSFGLVAMPIKIHSSSSSEGGRVKLNTLHNCAEHGAIKQRKVCSACGETASESDILKGYTASTGSVVVVNEGDLPNDETRNIVVSSFVPRECIPLEQAGTSRWLFAEPAGAKAYRLLHRILSESNSVGVVQFAMRTSTNPGFVQAIGDHLVLTDLPWVEHVYEPPVIVAAEITDEELTLGRAFVAAMTTDNFALPRNVRKTAVIQALEARAAGGQGVIEAAGDGQEATSAGRAESLLDTIQRSYDALLPAPQSAVVKKSRAPRKAKQGAEVAA